jgi:hypothetical protein
VLLEETRQEAELECDLPNCNRWERCGTCETALDLSLLGLPHLRRRPLSSAHTHEPTHHRIIVVPIPFVLCTRSPLVISPSECFCLSYLLLLVLPIVHLCFVALGTILLGILLLFSSTFISLD